MAESKREVLRKPTPAEEIASLHPIERFLLRTFETLASVKLAVILMLWLSVECTIGTLLESRVNAPAAKYFIYQTMRFYLLLALLGMNILCAALIRFPWRLYQTGFVVTHTGLLILLFGSLMTARSNVDAQMSVRLGETESTYLNPDQEQLVVGKHSRGGDVREYPPIPVKFGPFTWGTDVLGGLIPWRHDHVEEYQIDRDVTLRVKKFFANCTPEKIFVESERGAPAIHYRLYHPERADFSQWINADPTTMFGQDVSLPIGRLVLWRVDSDKALDHFVKAVPVQFSGLMGDLAYSHGGKHHLFSVDELLKEPATVPDSDVTISIAEYLPNAKLDQQKGEWYSEGEVPENPLLRIHVKQGETESEYLAFGARPEWSSLLAQRFGTEHLFTYFPADTPATIHLAITPDGKLGYRAFGSGGLIASEFAEEGKEYRSWAGLNFVPKEIIGSGKPDLRLRPKLLKSGEVGMHGIVVELDNGSEKVETAVSRGMPVSQRLGDELYTIDYGLEQGNLPFQVQLDDFHEPTNPGTRQAAAYESNVTVIDEERNVRKENTRIYMNNPLYYEGSDGIKYTLYQSGIDRSTGTPISTFTVANDPGLEVKYAGAIVLCTGIVLMFYMGGYFKKGSAAKRKRREAAKQAASLETVAG